MEARKLLSAVFKVENEAARIKGIQSIPYSLPQQKAVQPNPIRSQPKVDPKLGA